MGSFRNFFRRNHRHHKSQSSPTTNPDQHHFPEQRHPAEELERVFKKFDSNGDGKISSSELAAICESLGQAPTDDELQSMMAEADSDGDGFISLEEFVDLNTRGVEPADVLEDIRSAFSVFDLDHNGSISADELAKVLRSIGEGATTAQCRKMIGGVDQNGDGLISFEEFKAMMISGSSFCASLKKIQE